MSSGGAVLPPNTFGKQATTPAPQQNQACLACHETGTRDSWAGSTHELADIACASCHLVHTPEDRVFDAETQQQACFQCHSRQRSDSLKNSVHPLRFGAISCSSCHEPHGGDHDFMLTEPTVNDTCYTCHAEKRGPFLWEHAPAAEDCMLCHQAHGSNHDALLTRRAPLLCQQCHAPVGHPSLALTNEDFEDDHANRFMLSRGCLNCHSQVHGSNHPSGATLHR
jgi:DmsE family decaheme c-type cytochrome